MSFPYPELRLKQLGKNGITPEVQLQLAKALKKESPKNIKHDIQLAPEWISKLILSLIN